jgi:hypothetical protein
MYFNLEGLGRYAAAIHEYFGSVPSYTIVFTKKRQLDEHDVKEKVYRLR